MLSDAVFFAAAPQGKGSLRQNNATIADLIPNSALLRRLERQGPPLGVRYHSLIGQKGFLPKERREILRREWAREVKRLTLDAASASAAKDLLDKLTELHEGLGDGVVSVDSARLRSATSQRIVPLDHFELLSQPDEAFRFVIEEMGWQTAKGRP